MNQMRYMTAWSNTLFIPALAIIGIMALGIAAAVFLAIRAAINAIF